MKSTWVYIAGYVTKKDKPNANDTFNYVEKFGRFTLDLNGYVFATLSFIHL